MNKLFLHIQTWITITDIILSKYVADTHKNTHSIISFTESSKKDQINQWLSVRIVVFFGKRSKWEEAWFFWTVDKILSLDLWDVYTYVLTWPKLIMLYTYDLCNVLYIWCTSIKLLFEMK